MIIEEPSTISTQRPHKAGLKLPERPKHILEMEERAKARKEKRELLKLQYVEKINKEAEEKKQVVLRAEEERKKKLVDEREMKK